MPPCIWKAFYPEKWKLARPRYCTHLTALHPPGLCLVSLQKRSNKGLSLRFLSRAWGILDCPCFSQPLPETTGIPPLSPCLCFTRWRSAASRNPILAISQQNQCLLTLLCLRGVYRIISFLPPSLILTQACKVWESLGNQKHPAQHCS